MSGRHAAAYIVGLAAVVVAAAARTALAPALDHALYLIFIPGVLAAAALGGAGPGLASTILAAAAAFLMQARAGASPDLVGMAFFVLIGLGLAAGGEGLARNRAHNEAAVRAVQEREAHLQSILDTVPDAMIVIDERGIVQSFSAAAERLFLGGGRRSQRQYADALALPRSA